jgi:hypothetical protein
MVAHAIDLYRVINQYLSIRHRGLLIEPIGEMHKNESEKVILSKSAQILITNIEERLSVSVYGFLLIKLWSVRKERRN